MLPPFEESGDLPAGIHEASWNEFAARYGTTPHRRNLLDGLNRALDSLRRAGCRRAYIDGSFVAAKEHPSDFDACWEETNVDPLILDPALLDFSDRRRARKAEFGGELFPANMPAGPAYADSTTSSTTGTPRSRRALSPSTSRTSDDHQRTPVQDHQGVAEEVRGVDRPA